LVSVKKDAKRNEREQDEEEQALQHDTSIGSGQMEPMKRPEVEVEFETYQV